MADVKWIKITTDVFDDEKILMIESLPSADSIIVIWFKLLAFAGKQNNDGVFLMSNRIAYTDEMLASIFRRDVNVVRLALKAFEEYGMIEIVNNVICIPNWNKHQTLDAYEKKKERDRLYQQNRRAAQRALIANNSLCENGIPLKQWKQVLDEFGHKCAYCGNEEGLEQEHIVPVKKGGKYEIGNIVPACRHCNASKNDKEFVGWYTKSDVYDEERFLHIVKYIESNKKSSDKSSDVVVSEEDREEDKEKDKDINIIISDSDEPEQCSEFHNKELHEGYVLLTPEEFSDISDHPDHKKYIKKAADYIKRHGEIKGSHYDYIKKLMKETKHKYGEYKHVLLTDEEVGKLKSEYGEGMTRNAITFLDEYIEMKGYKAKSHYLAIRKWVVDAVKERDRKQGRKEIVPDWMKKTPRNSFNSFSQQNQYDFDEMEKSLFDNEKTVDNDPELAARAEALKKKLGGV